MNHNKLTIQLKAVIIGVAVFGLMVYLWIVPMLGKSIAAMVPEFSHAFMPWLLFLWAMGIFVAASALSHFIMEAADLQEQSDFTI